MTDAALIEDMAPVMRGKVLEDVVQEATDAGGGLLFNALLYPNRSLPNKGFYAVMAVVGTVHLIGAVIWLVVGAWPVIFFAGADVLAVWLAFKISYRQGRHHERLLLTGEELWVCRVLPSGHETRWQLQPYWTRVLIDRPVKHESQLRLVSHGRTLIVGYFLSPKERGDLADALMVALAGIREGRKRPSQAGF